MDWPRDSDSLGNLQSERPDSSFVEVTASTFRRRQGKLFFKAFLGSPFLLDTRTSALPTLLQPLATHFRSLPYS
jgi:hypothetical protein